MVTIEDVDTARRLIREKPSASYLQRKMLITYNDALILMDIFVEEGVVRWQAGRWTFVDQQSGEKRCAD